MINVHTLSDTIQFRLLNNFFEMQCDSFNFLLFLIEIDIGLTQIAFLRFFVLSMGVMEFMINT